MVDPYERAFVAWNSAGGMDATNDGWRKFLAEFMGEKASVIGDDVLDALMKVFQQREWV